MTRGPDRRPVLFVTNLVPPDRAGAFAELHDRAGIELALFGGRSHHATAGVDPAGIPHRHVSQREAGRLAASGRYRAVVCGTAGRVALPAAYAGARAARVPFVLWTALWAQPRSPAHAAGALLLAWLYRRADAVVAYGPHVAAHARARGARRVWVAPQAVDAAFWTSGDPGTGGAGGTEGSGGAPVRVAFVGRDAPGKGLDVLLAAWRRADLAPGAELLLVGPGRSGSDGGHGEGIRRLGPKAPGEVRNLLRSAAVLVVPSVPTPTFREPWGLVCNEAMHLGLPVIASTAVGAAAGGLVRHERNGLVVPAGDPAALAAALARLVRSPELRARLGRAARDDVAPYTFAAWAAGFAAALEAAPPTSRGAC
jgi:glycosyltransferase involved in cell wall biosynthesis